MIEKKRFHYWGRPRMPPIFRLSQSANGATTNHPAALQLLSGCLDWALIAWALIYVFWQHLCIVFTRFEISLFISIQRGLLIEKEIRDCFLRIFLLFCAKLFHDFMKSFPRFLRNVFFFQFLLKKSLELFFSENIYIISIKLIASSYSV